MSINSDVLTELRKDTMTTTVDTANETHATDFSTLHAQFAPLFDSIAEQVLDRERNRVLPFAQVRALQQAGFTSLRVPVEFGGRGVDFDIFLELFLKLATVDSNVAHLLRGHIAQVESLLLQESGPHRSRWLRRIAQGALIGNAASERNELTEITTTLTRSGKDFTVSGHKYYTTGSIYADWISLGAVRDGERFGVLVRADDPGVSIQDDWDGFGQQLTGSGSLQLHQVPVDPSDITAFDPADPHLAFRVSLFQGILLLVAAGIAQNAVNDAIEFVKPRKRTFAVAGELIPAQQDLVQSVVGEAAAKAYAAKATALRLAKELSDYAGSAGQSVDGEQLAVDVFKAQQVILKLAQETATEIFEVGGASATSTNLRLDRHWRNVRTVASHNPAKYRARLVGQYLLTGTLELYTSRG